MTKKHIDSLVSSGIAKSRDTVVQIPKTQTLTYLLVFARVGDYHFSLVRRRAAHLNVRALALLVLGIILPSPPFGRLGQFATPLSSGRGGR